MKVGFVAVVGRPNTGKSTLINSILEYDLSITSEKPQTTRDNIRGIYNDSNSQIVFVDTPGIHKPKQKLGTSLNEASYASLKDADLVLFLKPSDEKIGPGDKRIIDLIKDKHKAAVITKLDLLDSEAQAKEQASELKWLGFNNVLGTSFKIKESLNALINFIKEELPKGKPFYDRDEVTDKSMRFIAKEKIRESAIRRLNDELPHSLGVLIDEFKEGEKIIIDATIFVERESQKGIVIGKNGSMIKKIGVAARKALMYTFDQKVQLNLRVKVNKKWTENLKEIKKMGY